MLSGGAGDDTFIIDSVNDSIIEQVNEGVDSVASSVDYQLGENIENLVLQGESDLSGTGNVLNNIIIGNSGSNQLSGGAGNDHIDGGAGDDALSGGAGDDTFVIDSVNDSIIEQANEGVDSVASSVDYQLGENIENLVLQGENDLSGTGNALNNFIIGNGGSNQLSGGAGDDVLIGNQGVDFLNGGFGNDGYSFARGDGGDQLHDSGGVDALFFGETIAHDQLWFTRTSNDLSVSLIGTSDEVNITDWYADDANKIESIRTTSGLILYDNQVQQLVDAMAAFAPPSSGELNLSSEYKLSLDPVIAASWVNS